MHARKLRRAIGKSEYGLAERLKASRPHYSLDAIIRERFPTFIDAVRYLPDCLDMCFAYATMPASRRTPADKVALCRRLTVEFILYVITSRSLRKVFVSIKVLSFYVSNKIILYLFILFSSAETWRLFVDAFTWSDVTVSLFSTKLLKMKGHNVVLIVITALLAMPTAIQWTITGPCLRMHHRPSA